MKFDLKRVITLIVLMLSLVSMSAQVRRVTTVTPGAKSRSATIEVYEFDWVDVQPQFPGGELALMNFISKTREYPYMAYKNHVQGRVVCSFIVGTDGRVSNVRVIRGAGDETLDREAVRVINAMPRWNVGKVDGTPVNVRCVLPIAFRL